MALQKEDQSKPKILVVDDNQGFIGLLTEVFDWEFRILQAGNGAEGLELARKEKPRVILLDMMMPKVSGIEMLRELQGDMDTRAIPVLILTASEFDDQMIKQLRSEVNVKGMLSKPCSLDILREKIHTLVKDAPAA